MEDNKVGFDWLPLVEENEQFRGARMEKNEPIDEQKTDTSNNPAP